MIGLLISHGAVAIVIGICGYLAGWLHGGRLAAGWAKRPSDERRLLQYISRLHGLSARIAADVDEHHSTLGGIDRELSQMGNGDISSVSELVERLVAANEAVQAKLRATERKVGEISSQMDHHAQEARTDVLTGVANRRAFEEEATRCHVSFQEADQPFSLIMVDIDHFKQVNDVHGHLVGDDVLRKIARTLQDHFRGRDFISRYGGEEFSVLMPGTCVREARAVADRVRESIEKTPVAEKGYSLGVTISLGVAEVIPFEEVSELTARADQALYAAKQAGRNRVYWHDGSMPHPLHLSPEKTAAGEDGENDGSAAIGGSPAGTPGAAADGTNALLRSAPATATRKVKVLRADDIDVAAMNQMNDKMMLCQDVRRRVATFNRSGSPFAAILLRIDESEKLISSHGEPVWQLIRGMVALAVRDQIRERDVTAVYNGSTFGIVLPNAPLCFAVHACERIRETVQQTVLQVNGDLVRVTISLGVAEMERGDYMERLMERVGRKLEEAQGGGGNRTSFSGGRLVAT